MTWDRRVEGRMVLIYSRSLEMDVPFEFVSQITGASPMAKASHVERCSAASRHCGPVMYLLGYEMLLFSWILHDWAEAEGSVEVE